MRLNLRVSLLSRRLLLPMLAILCVACAAAGAYGAVRLALGGESVSTLVWITIAVAGMACVGTAWLVKAYSRRQSAAIVDALQKAIPPREAQALLAIQPGRASIDDAVAAMAQSFAQLIEQAGKDKGQLQTVISSMNEGLVAVDQQQRILLANDAADELLGLKMPDAQGKPIWEQVAVEGVAHAAAEVMLTGQVRSFTAGPYNGKHLEITVSRLPEAAGVVIVAHDVTEATRYQRLREEFVANVSHELRTPLTIIKGFVETLRDGAIDDKERARRYLDTVANHTEQLSNLVNDVLDLSRLESSDSALKRGCIDVAQAVQNAADLLQPAAQRKSQNLTLDLAKNVPGVMGSGDYLSRAVANLIDNSIKYTRDGGEVRVRVESLNDAVLIAVEDNGMGISDDDLPRIFERFYRAEQSRSRDMGGTGLGLAIVKHIVQSHGGTIDVSSRLGAGTRFTIRLPAAPPP